MRSVLGPAALSSGHVHTGAFGHRDTLPHMPNAFSSYWALFKEIDANVSRAGYVSHNALICGMVIPPSREAGLLASAGPRLSLAVRRLRG